MPSGGDLEGTVVTVLPRGLYAVRSDDGRRVIATLSTEARRVTVKIIPGDRVLLVLSAFDPTRGRITVRLS